MRLLMIAVPLAMLVGCPGPDSADKDSAEGDTEDTASGGGQEDNWSAAGSGTAYFTDGETDNSLFTLELAGANEPRDGEAYYGFVSDGVGGDMVPLGEIQVNGEDVLFTSDIGENAILAGYSHFEAWASDGSGDEPEGDPVWEGDVDTTVYDVIQRLLIANPDTPDGTGSLRALESQLEFLRDECEAASNGGLTDAELALVGEKVGNALMDPTVDADNSGEDDMYDGAYPVTSDEEKGSGEDYIHLIAADFAAAAAVIDPRDPIRDYIEEAYDGLDLTEYTIVTFSADAARDVAGASTTAVAENLLDDVSEQMTLCLEGGDVNEDGVVDPQVEVGIEWAIDRTSYMAHMEVSVAN